MIDLKDTDFKKGALLLINKPYRWSSFDVVRKVRNTTKAKTGHGGTLDPLATGLLLIGTGSCTKLLGNLLTLDKEYTGTFYLGATTPSFDRETQPENFKDISAVTHEQLNEAVRQLTGTIAQRPPVFSAMKVKGKRSYELARKGQAEELKSREVQIKAFELTEIALPYVHFRVECSKGTYIRSLANDFGEIVGVGAYLYDLCRTRIGEYKLADAWDLDEFLETVKSMPQEQSTQSHADTQ